MPSTGTIENPPTGGTTGGLPTGGGSIQTAPNSTGNMGSQLPPISLDHLLQNIIGTAMTIVGPVALGATVGIMVGFFLKRTKDLTVSALAGAISILSGGGVLALFHLVAGQTPNLPPYAMWLYPVGLFFGLIAAMRHFENISGTNDDDN